jgi:hypothetical protein
LRRRCASKGLTRGLGAAFLAAFALAAPPPQEADAAARRAFWGNLTPYADAVAIDSPLRQARNAMRDGKSGETPLPETSRFQRFEYPVTHRHASAMEGLDGSATIAIGNVAHARSYLSNDKTAIYSEMLFAVTSVLADKSGASVKAGSQISMVRQGGAVRLPSGRFLVRGCSDESLPRIGHQYLLFLQYSKPAQVFPMLNAFELADTRVYLLDTIEYVGVAPRSSKPGVWGQLMLAEYGLPPRDFVEVVTKLIAKSPAWAPRSESETTDSPPQETRRQ